MLRIVGWAVAAYLVLKLAHIAARPARRYDASATMAETLRAGEPMLLIAALVFALLLTAYLDWFTHRLGRREYGHARGCYGEIETARQLPATQGRLNRDEAERQGALYLRVGLKHGAWLGRREDPIRKDFERARLADLERYSRNGSANATSALLHDVGRCFRDEWEPHGELLNP